MYEPTPNEKMVDTLVAIGERVFTKQDSFEDWFCRMEVYMSFGRFYIVVTDDCGWKEVVENFNSRTGCFLVFNYRDEAIDWVNENFPKPDFGEDYL